MARRSSFSVVVSMARLLLVRITMPASLAMISRTKKSGRCGKEFPFLQVVFWLTFGPSVLALLVLLLLNLLPMWLGTS